MTTPSAETVVKYRMARHPLFLDDDTVADALDEASDAAIARLAQLLPELASSQGASFRNRLRTQLAAMLSGRTIAVAAESDLPPLVHGDDAFGDRFALENLSLPRAGSGYAVQMLDTDTLFDRRTGDFLAVRDAALQGLFDSFDSAHAAARTWLRERNATTDQYALAIVPAYYDNLMHRHVLVYGVLTRSP